MLAALPANSAPLVRAPDAQLLSDDARDLYGALLDALVVANGDLRSLTLGADGELNVTALSDAACEWEVAVTPLAWAGVEAAWARCGVSGVVRARDGCALARLVEDLADAALVHLDDAPGGAQLWPTSAAQVVAALSPSWFARVGEGMQPLVAALCAASGVARLGA